MPSAAIILPILDIPVNNTVSGFPEAPGTPLRSEGQRSRVKVGQRESAVEPWFRGAVVGKTIILSILSIPVKSSSVFIGVHPTHTSSGRPAAEKDFNRDAQDIQDKQSNPVHLVYPC